MPAGGAETSTKKRKRDKKKLDPYVDAAAQLSVPTCWIADTGCGFDLLCMKWVDETDRKRLSKPDNPMLFSGVGGTKAAELKLRLQSPALGGTVEPLVMENTPDVLTIGRRCVELGWSFWWAPYSLHPTLTTKEGKKIVCNVRGFIPYIDEVEGGEPSPVACGPTTSARLEDTTSTTASSGDERMPASPQSASMGSDSN